MPATGRHLQWDATDLYRPRHTGGRGSPARRDAAMFPMVCMPRDSFS